METLLYDDFDNIPSDRTVERPHRNDVYMYEKFTESSAPALAVLAQRVHAEGYRSMEFVREGAIMPDGTLSPEIDKARGEFVEYYAGIDPNAEDDELDGVSVTLRKISIPAGGSLEDLPAYKLCADTLYDGEEEKLKALPEPDKYVKEIGALARVERSNPLATLELIRNVFHEAWTGNPGQTWLLSIVKSTYDTFEDNFGNIAIRRLGDPVKFDDGRVGDRVELIPAVVDVDNFLDNIIAAMEDDENRSHRNRMLRTILFFSEGLKDQEMSESVRSLRHDYMERFKGRSR